MTDAERYIASGQPLPTATNNYGLNPGTVAEILKLTGNASLPAGSPSLNAPYASPTNSDQLAANASAFDVGGQIAGRPDLGTSTPIFNSQTGQWTAGGQVVGAPQGINSTLPGESPEQLVQRIQGTTTPSAPIDTTYQNNALSLVYSRRPDLQALYNPDGTAKDVNNPKVAGIPTLTDWAKKYGYTEDSLLTSFGPQSTQPSSTTSPSSIPPVVTTDILRTKDRAAEIARIKAEAEKGVTKPPLYKSLDEFNKLRTEQGVVKDEEELASIRNEYALANEELRQFKSKAGEGVSEGGRIGAVSEAERNLNFRLEGLAIREQAVISRLNSKNAYISTALQLGGQDYQTAYNDYTNEYNKNLKAIDTYNQELDTQKKDALTSFTTISNLLSQSGTPITPEISAQLDTLALQAGLPSGILQEALKGLQQKEKIDNLKVVGNNVYMWTTTPDGTPSLKLIQTIQGGEEWGTPYVMGTNYVQKNSQTGEIRTVGSTGGGGGTDLKRLLTLAEQEAYGLPAGSTMADAIGKNPLAPTQRTALNDIQKSIPLIDTLRGMVSNLGLGNDTINSIAKGTYLQAQSFIPSTVAGQYKSQANAFVALITRALGEKGTLAEGDVARIKNALPGFYDTISSATNKLNTLTNIMNDVYNKSLSGYYDNPQVVPTSSSGTTTGGLKYEIIP